MSASDAISPRIYLVRHGHTEWAMNGRHTSFTDIPLTEEGLTQVSSTADTFVGVGKLIDPHRIARVYCSPRLRATQTLERFQSAFSEVAIEPIYTEEIAEWNYGTYEGLTKGEIKELREKQSLDSKWSVWKNGCEGGESTHDVTKRVDKFISQIKEFQRDSMGGENPADVFIVSHGLYNRCFAKRWIGAEIDDNLPFMLAPGAIITLSYKNNDINAPGLHIGLPVRF